jgi:hypothetical protein
MQIGASALDAMRDLPQCLRVIIDICLFTGGNIRGQLTDELGEHGSNNSLIATEHVE